MKRVLFLLLVVIALIGITITGWAQTGAGYDLSWWTIDSGGSLNNTGGAYSLSASIGQPDASVASSSGYTLLGGFWGGVGSVSIKNYLPVVIR